MPVIEVLVAAIASGVAPTILNLLEGRRRVRSAPRDNDEDARAVSAYVAEQAAGTVLKVVDSVVDDQELPPPGGSLAEPKLHHEVPNEELATAIRDQLNNPEVRRYSASCSESRPSHEALARRR